MPTKRRNKLRRSFAQKTSVLAMLCLATLHVATLRAQEVDPAIASRQGYRMHDGSVQIVTALPVAGITRALDQVYLQTHPGARFTVREGDNYSAMAALTFDRTLVAPLGCAYTRIGPRR